MAKISQLKLRIIMKKFALLAVLMALVFGGCSAKEFNEGVDSITSDISSKQEEGRDKSAD